MLLLLLFCDGRQSAPAAALGLLSPTDDGEGLQPRGRNGWRGMLLMLLGRQVYRVATPKRRPPVRPDIGHLLPLPHGSPVCPPEDRPAGRVAIQFGGVGVGRRAILSRSDLLAGATVLPAVVEAAVRMVVQVIPLKGDEALKHLRYINRYIKHLYLLSLLVQKQQIRRHLVAATAVVLFLLLLFFVFLVLAVRPPLGPVH